MAASCVESKYVSLMCGCYPVRCSSVCVCQSFVCFGCRFVTQKLGEKGWPMNIK